MSDLMNAIIAAKLVGGGGGGSGSGLPPIETTTTVILETQSLSFESAYGLRIAMIDGQLVLGTPYTVSFDGTDYDVVCYNHGGVPTIGNTHIFGEGTDTGEPFLCMNESGQIAMATSTGATHIVGISSSITNYPDGSVLVAINGEWTKAEGYGYVDSNNDTHKIDNKYLPFLVINVDRNNQTIDCDYATYKTAIEAGCPIWLCETQDHDYYMLEGGNLSVTNPILSGTRWSYDPTKSVGYRLSADALTVYMQVGSSGWSVTAIEIQTVNIPNV